MRSSLEINKCIQVLCVHSPCLESTLALVSASDAFEPAREREVVLHSVQCIESREKERKADKQQEKHGSNEGSSIRENIRYVPRLKKL